MTPSSQTPADEMQVYWSKLSRCWFECAETWNDSNREAFEQQFWSPLNDEIRLTLMSMTRTSQTTDQVRSSVK